MFFDFFKIINVFNIQLVNNFKINKNLQDSFNDNKEKYEISQEYLKNMKITFNETILKEKNNKLKKIVEKSLLLTFNDDGFEIIDNFYYIYDPNINISKDILKNYVIIGIGYGILANVEKFDYTLFPIGYLNNYQLPTIADFKKFQNCIHLGYIMNNNIKYIGYHLNIPIYNKFYLLSKLENNQLSDNIYNFYKKDLLDNLKKVNKSIKKLTNFFLLNIISLDEIKKYYKNRFNNLNYITLSNVYEHYNLFYNLKELSKEILYINNGYILIDKNSDIFYKINYINEKITKDLLNKEIKTINIEKEYLNEKFIIQEKNENIVSMITDKFIQNKLQELDLNEKEDKKIKEIRIKEENIDWSKNYNDKSTTDNIKKDKIIDID